MFSSAYEYMSDSHCEAKWLDADALAGWTGCCDEMWLTVVASEGVLLSWWHVLQLYWIIPYSAVLVSLGQRGYAFE
jgi:hypothetical protein